MYVSLSICLHVYVLAYVSIYVFLCMYTYPSHYRYLFVVGVSVHSACVSVSMNTHDLFIKNWQVACILRSAGPATELESQCFSLS